MIAQGIVQHRLEGILSLLHGYTVKFCGIFDLGILMQLGTYGNMLRRQLAKKKDQLSKKLKGMNPDERVQVMIDA
jgi:hypothetical protein